MLTYVSGKVLKHRKYRSRESQRVKQRGTTSTDIRAELKKVKEEALGLTAVKTQFQFLIDKAADV